MSRTGIHAAGLNSPRLQRVLQVLSDGRPHTTRDIVRKARVVAVNAVISELRSHGAEILCRRQSLPRGGVRPFYYTMLQGPKAK